MKSIIGLLIIKSFFFSPLQSQGTVDFYFPKQLQKMRIGRKLQIKTALNDDAFFENLTRCKPKFYIGLKSKKNYFLEDRGKVNQINVAEYIFKDTIASNNAFFDVYEYVENSRKLGRGYYGTKCFQLPDPQIYYACKSGSHIFLFTMSYNFQFNSKEESVDTNMKNDKLILLDDLYNEMVKDHD